MTENPKQFTLTTVTWIQRGPVSCRCLLTHKRK